MRILLVSANFRPHVGGIERFTEILAGGLVRRGHSVTVVCCRYDSALLREEVDGFSVRRVPASYVLARRLNVPYPLPAPPSLLRCLRTELARADVVHVQDAVYASSVVALALARRRGVPTVLTQHVAFVPQRSRLLDAVESAALATLGRSARLATVVACLNPAVAEWVEQQWAIRGVRVLPVGIPSQPEEPRGRAEVRRSFGLPPDRFLALFVGRDVSKKGLDVFFAAADPAYDLVAVTDRLPGSSEARVIPFMSPDRLHDLLGCVDAFVLPSEGEGFPITLQEALARGLPVVTTLQPGYERYLSSDDVIYVERDAKAVRSALLRLVADEELRRRLAERARAVAELHFGVDRFVTAYEDLYEEVRATGGGRSYEAPLATGRWTLKRPVADALRRLGLLGFVFRAYESFLARDWLAFGRRREERAPDRLPVPPKELRVRAGPRAADLDFFLEAGAQDKAMIVEALERDGSRVETFSAILDLGCGCGRVIRHWRGVQGPSLHGCDISEEQIRWCSDNLPFASFALNGLSPPLDYRPETFDLAYALSVFTHLPEELQRSWMQELLRVLRPGGYLLFSTHGEPYLDRLTNAERERFASGEQIVLYEEGAGTGLCSTYTPQSYVENVLGESFRYVAFVPAGAGGQDAHLLRK